MVDYINDNKPDHILTIEDPIEFVHESKKSLINQREVHRDTLGFNEALRSALREDPDVILVGELRDLETIRLALTAAETGHLVFGTLHTSSAAKTVDRIVDVFPAAEKEMVRAMLSESLRAVISQTLLKKVGGGRIAAHEIMVGTPAIRKPDSRGQDCADVFRDSDRAGSGHVHARPEPGELMAKGLINKEEARFRAVNKEKFLGRRKKFRTSERRNGKWNANKRFADAKPAERKMVEKGRLGSVPYLWLSTRDQGRRVHS